MTLRLVDPSKIPHRHAVPVNERPFDLEVDFGFVFADVPDGVDRRGVRRNHLVADLWDSRFPGFGHIGLSPQLGPVRMRGDGVDAAAVRASAVVAVDAESVAHRDYGLAVGAGLGELRDDDFAAATEGHRGILDL